MFEKQVDSELLVNYYSLNLLYNIRRDKKHSLVHRHRLAIDEVFATRRVIPGLLLYPDVEGSLNTASVGYHRKTHEQQD